MSEQKKFIVPPANQPIGRIVGNTVLMDPAWYQFFVEWAADAQGRDDDITLADVTTLVMKRGRITSAS